jgi:ribonuclease R
MPAQKAKRTKKEIFLGKLEHTIRDHLSARGMSPISHADLLEELQLPKSQESLFDECLEAMIAKGDIRDSAKGYRLGKESAEVVTGVIRVHPRGFGFLQPDNPAAYPEDIFIPRNFIQNAVDGDRVEVMINQQSVSERGPEGKVINILTRGRTHMAGIVKEILSKGKASVYVPLLGVAQSCIATSPDIKLVVGDRIVMEVKEWGTENSPTQCRATHRIGHISDPSVDIKAAVEEFELRSDFPATVLQEAKQYGTSVTQAEIAGREDFREIETFTIDPDTAKDFDDALSLHQDENGNFHLAVHIADVSHYVAAGTQLDLEARERCNSTYFPGTCIPMLPGELSENLCSLKPNVNRLTISVLVTFDKYGNQLSYRIVRGVIKSQKRFTYKEAKEVLDGTKKSKHAPTLNLMVDLCKLLKKQRYNRGSIEFAMPELVVLVNNGGVPTGTDYIVYDITHQLVEEFMLKANEIVATHLTQNGKNLIYRVHDEPADENMKDFSMIATAFGFELSEIPKATELQKLFEETAESPYSQFLATSYIRRMRMAQYSADNIGHFGLQLSHYTHFTSPIRRYVDLVVHRILFGEKDIREDLVSSAGSSSEQERISAKAEGSVRHLKKLRLLDAQYKKDKFHQYEAIVTRVKPFGVMFEIIDLLLEGFLHVSEIGNDYYVFDEDANTLQGENYGNSLTAGDKIHVILKNVDFILQESHWAIVTDAPPAKKQKHRHQKPQKKTRRKRR